MPTLAADALRTLEIGEIQEYPVVAADIIYSHAAVGLVDASGYARPLVGGDRFVGFAEKRCDNSAGAAAAKTIRVMDAGKVVLNVAGAVITDVRQPVYATDDDTFVFSPVGGSFIGFVSRFISAGVVLVDFDVSRMHDPWRDYAVRETISVDKTLDAEDSGKLFWVDTDARIVTLPAIATGLDSFVLVNGGAFGTVAVSASPNAADMVLGPDITGADNKDLINAKATARRGDFVVLGGNDADGFAVQRLRGIWVREA